MESGSSTDAEEAERERESLLKPAKEKLIQVGASQILRNENQITLTTNQTSELITINGRMSYLPPFGSQDTAITKQRNHQEKVIELWKQHGK